MRHALIASLLLLAACGGKTPASQAPATQPSTSPAAATPVSVSTTLESRSGSSVTGTATFTQTDDGVSVVIDVKNATPGEHGVHLHEKGDCSAEDASSAGPHFNPGDHPHGAPSDAPHHAGDLGNITVGADGAGHHEVVSRGLTVAAGPTSVVGRALVVHASADDLASQPAGNSGARIACGVIR